MNLLTKDTSSSNASGQFSDKLASSVLPGSCKSLPVIRRRRPAPARTPPHCGSPFLIRLLIYQTNTWGAWIVCNAVTRGFKTPHGMALELVCRAENRCKSSGAPAGAFPKLPRAKLGREAAQTRRFPILPHPSPKKPKHPFDCIRIMLVA